jgi:protein TonB
MPENAAVDQHVEVRRTDHGRAGLPAVPAGSNLATPADVVASRAAENVSGSAAATEDYVAPKLLHAVKPVAPPDALRSYITGNVNVDALVDTVGHVRSVTVLSGPPKLRETAIEEMKQYLYEPARKNGKAVTSHVQASLQFWYEP